MRPSYFYSSKGKVENVLIKDVCGISVIVIQICPVYFTPITHHSFFYLVNRLPFTREKYLLNNVRNYGGVNAEIFLQVKFVFTR